MILRIAKLVLLLLILLAASGCWDRKELNELGIVLAMAIDKDEQLGYKVSCQVVVPSEVASNSGKSTTTPVTLVQASATTIHEALYKMSLSSPRNSYLSHIRLLIFSEEIAKEGIAEVLEALLRDPTVRPDYYVAIARDTPAEDVLTILTPLESIPANSLFYSLKNSSESWAPTITAFTDKIIEKMVSGGIEPVLTGVRIRGDSKAGGEKENLSRIKPEAKLVFTGMAVLIKDKLVGWMDEKESKGFNYIEGLVKETTGHIECPDGDGTLTLLLLRAGSSIEPKLVNGEPEFEVKSTVVQSIYADSCKESLSNDSTIRELEKLSEQKLNEIMADSVKAAQVRFKSDIFGFGRELSHKYPKEWKKTFRKNWNERFATLKVKFSVDAQIRRLGTLDDSIMRQTKEETE